MALFPTALRDALQKATTPILKKRGFSEARIISDWHEIVGEELSGAATPLRIQTTRNTNAGAVLTVGVHPAYALEVQQMTPTILEKIHTYFGYQAITRIVIEQRYQELGPAASKPTSKQEAEPISDDESDPLTRVLRQLVHSRNQQAQSTDDK